METFKVIVAGSRGFGNYQLLKEKLDIILAEIDEPIEIVCGGAKGADHLGKKYGKEKGYQVKMFLPDWSVGKQAGYIRNKEMAEYADACVVFWDGSSKGTSHMIDLANKYKLKLRVIKYVIG